jgi:SNF2 family DNA or RNA helicase
LTGTPIQNNLMELWCLLDWTNPNCLGSAASFEEKWVRPILEGQRFDSTKRELAVTRTKQEELSKLIGNWFLRRTKLLITSQLPSKGLSIIM